MNGNNDNGNGNEENSAKELARNLDKTIEQMVGRIDFDDSGGSNPMGVSPEQAIGMMRPMLSQYARKNPEEVKRVIAIIHLETGGLLDYHTDDGVDAEDLV